MLKANALFKKKFKLVSFIKNESGAILLSFIILLPILIGLILLSLELSFLIQKKAKLSDAIEQATLALTVGNHDIPDAIQAQKNNDLVSYYAKAYLPSEKFSTPIIEINNNLSHLEYDVNITMNYPAYFFKNTIITRANNNIIATDSGSAKKHLAKRSEPTDIVFVVDYSGSMEDSFEHSKSTESKIDVLRKIFINLNDKIKNNNDINILGFVPFSWGSKIIEGDKTFCHYPFVPKKYRSNGDYLRQYTASGLNKFQGLENLKNILDIEYGELSQEEEDIKAVTDAIKENIVDDKQLSEAIKFLYSATSINRLLSIFEIIADNIDYDKTIKSITQKTETINIPMSDVLNNGLCLRNINTHIIDRSNMNNSILLDALNFDVNGGTLISSGILAGNNIFKQVNNEHEKIMIILSDGDDSNHIHSDLPDSYENKNYFNITKKLIEKGMCDRIRENNIRMVFIGIGYIPREDLDWKECVGEGNFYLAHNAYELAQDLEQVLIADAEVGRNTPKK
ncbi:VWA domain-containing protein [Yersinia canariae]|uniref:VWA domain-containing protein n=1 Tax=Yersinia canariae TaxID=2607663 RepID=A0A857F4T2_9GAMM|nr:TadE/TadG family protein [Yersinia canariae]QHB33975.1 VWA domain-containing protein [Yersinia canariae]